MYLKILSYTIDPKGKNTYRMIFLAFICQCSRPLFLKLYCNCDCDFILRKSELSSQQIIRLESPYCRRPRQTIWLILTNFDWSLWYSTLWSILDRKLQIVGILASNWFISVYTLQAIYYLLFLIITPKNCFILQMYFNIFWNCAYDVMKCQKYFTSI